MKIAYIDTSCLAAIAFDERTSARVQRQLATFDQLASAPLLEAELRAALRREGSVGSPRLEELLDAVHWVAAERPLRMEIATVLNVGYVRGADCWHLATALYFSPQPSQLSFLTLDARQRAVARALGFKA